MTSEQLRKYRERVVALASFGHRGSTTEREHAAADWIVEELRASGFDPIKEPFAGSSSLGGRVLLHVMIAAIGAVCLWAMPVVSIVASILALGSLWAEQSQCVVWLSRPLIRRASANVVATLCVSAPRQRIVLCAHYDTQRTGWIWILFQYFAPLLWYVPNTLKPPLLPFAATILAQIGLGCFAWWGGASEPIAIGGVAILSIYAIHVVLIGQWARGPFVPGAGDNASGAAAVLTLANAWRDRPVDDVELVVLLTACEETGMLGSAAWADAHRVALGELPTMFLNLDSFGFGKPRYFGVDVPLVGLPARYPAQLVADAAACARDVGLDDAGPHSMSGPTDGLALLRRKIPGMTIISFSRHGRMPHFHRCADTCENLDFDAAGRAVEFSWAMLNRMAAREPLAPSWK